MLSTRDSRLLENLAGWLNLKMPPLADAQREVRETIGLLRSRKHTPRVYAALRRTFSKFPLDCGVFWIADRFYLSNVIHSVEMIGLADLRDICAVTHVEIKELSLNPGAFRVDPLKQLLECKRCHQWFVGRGELQHKRFCSVDCREKFWSEQRKTPRGRKKEAQRLRDWREAKRKAAAALAAAAAKKSQGGKQS